MEKQISIIIPTYNMEKYIGKCLDSLLIPEIEQVEIFVVNDGSKDRSSEIAHSYAERYPQSIRVIDKPNGNYGSCINAALPQCTGRYVKILDADDTFDSQAFSQFVRTLPSIDEDALITGFLILSEKGDTRQPVINENFVPNQRYSKNQAIAIIGGHYIQMHRLAYSKEIFRRFSYFQSEGISYTDSQWSIIPLAYCNSFRWIDLSIYKYLIGREGQTMAPEIVKKSLDQRFKVMYDIIASINSLNINKESFELIRGSLLYLHSCVYSFSLDNLTVETARMLKNYDQYLFKENLTVYNDIGSILYSPEINYKIYRDFRKKNYDADFKVPFIKRLELSLKVRYKRIFN